MLSIGLCGLGYFLRDEDLKAGFDNEVFFVLAHYLCHICLSAFVSMSHCNYNRWIISSILQHIPNCVSAASEKNNIYSLAVAPAGCEVHLSFDMVLGYYEVASVSTHPKQK